MNLCEGIKPTWPNRNLLSQRKRMNNKIHANSVGLLSMSDRAQTWHELKQTVTAVCNKRKQRMFHLFLYICLLKIWQLPIQYGFHEKSARHPQLLNAYLRKTLLWEERSVGTSGRWNGRLCVQQLLLLCSMRTCCVSEQQKGEPLFTGLTWPFKHVF